MRFIFSEQAFSSAVRNLLKQIHKQRCFDNFLGNESRRDSAIRVTANCIKNQKLRSTRLPILTCGYVTKLIPMGGEIAELVMTTVVSLGIQILGFEYGLMWDKSVQHSGPFIKHYRARILAGQLHCSLSLNPSLTVMFNNKCYIN
jgi:hypothetical protein